MISSLVFIYLSQKILKNVSHCNLVTLCILFNYSLLYAFERGNIIIIAMLLSMIFIQYKDSDNKYLQEIALISLGLSAGLKIYPAVLGLLLIYEKQYLKALRTIIYGVCSFILPVFAFHEGISGLRKFIEILMSFSSTSDFSTSGYSFDRFTNTIVAIFNPTLDFDTAFLVEILPKLNCLFTFIVLLLGFFMKKKWQQILSCCLSIIIIQPQGVYSLVYLIIPLLFFIKEEKEIKKESILPFCALLFPQLMLPQINLHNELLSFTNIRIQLCIWILFVYLITVACKNVNIPKRKAGLHKAV